MCENIQKDSWDKAAIFFEILKIVSIVVAALIINTTLKTNEIEIQYVKIAVDILKANPESETKTLREWAIKVLNDKSDIPLGKDEVKILLENKLPSKANWDGAANWDDKANWDDSATWEEKKEPGATTEIKKEKTN